MVFRKDFVLAGRYTDENAKRFENFSTTWKAVPPIVGKDFVVYGPPDAEMLMCLNRKDGKLRWQVERGAGLFPAAVHDGKLLIVEEQALRAIDMKDGKQVWKAPLPGFPVGRGLLIGSRYYVPLGSNGAIPMNPMIGVFEIADGTCHSLLRTPKGTIPLGNLIVHNDQIISQSIEGVAVFELVK